MVLQLPQEGTKGLSPEYFPWALIYRGAVPWETIEACSCRSAWSLLAEIIEDENWCFAQRDALSEMIFAYIGTLSDDQGIQRRLTIRLRRDLYNMLPTIKPQDLQALQAALPEAERPLLQHYWMRCQHLHTLKEQAQEQLQTDIAQARIHLWQTVQQTPALLKGITLIAPELYSQAQHFLEPTFKHKAGRLEKEEISLLLYLVRTATKTSAFSTFTSIALAYTTIDKQEHCQLQIADETQIAVASTNHLPLVLLTHHLTHQPALRRHLSLHVNPYCLEENGRYVTVRTTGYRAAMRNIAYTHVERISLPATPTLRELLAHVGTCTSTLHSLTQWLQARTRSADIQKAEQFIEQLLQMQFLVLDLKGLQTRTMIPEMLDQLALVPEQISSQQAIVEALHVIERDQQAYSSEPPAQRVQMGRNIVSSIEQCFQELGEAINPKTFEPALYESSILPPP